MNNILFRRLRNHRIAQDEEFAQQYEKNLQAGGTKLNENDDNAIDAHLSLNNDTCEEAKKHRETVRDTTDRINSNLLNQNNMPDNQTMEDFFDFIGNNISTVSCPINGNTKLLLDNDIKNVPNEYLVLVSNENGDQIKISINDEKVGKKLEQFLLEYNFRDYILGKKIGNSVYFI